MAKRGSAIVRGVTSVAIPVKDQDAALQFYTEKFGFKVATDRLMDDRRRWVELSIPGAETAIALVVPADPSMIGCHQSITFWCDDLQQTCMKLISRGVVFVHEPRSEAWRQCAIWKDLDGNTFTLSSRRKTRPPRLEIPRWEENDLKSPNCDPMQADQVQGVGIPLILEDGVLKRMSRTGQTSQQISEQPPLPLR